MSQRQDPYGRVQAGRYPLTRSPAHPIRAWPVWPLKAILAVLFLGPLAAPLFQATQLPVVADAGWLARDLLSRYVCPTPAKSYLLLGFPMAVCARCWGATIGLWAGWAAFRLGSSDQRPTTGGRLSGLHFVVRRLDGYLALPWAARLAIGALPFLLWVAEISWWAAAPLWLLLANGAFAGFWAGLFFCSIWPGLRRI